LSHLLLFLNTLVRLRSVIRSNAFAHVVGTAQFYWVLFYKNR
jgi:hypothetical protein